MESNSLVWQRFSADPRTQPDLRASDVDRNVVFEALGQAYALGQLDTDEHAERLERAGEIKLLGDAVPLLQDLVGAEAAQHADIEAAAGPEPSLERLDDDDTPLTPEAIDEAAVAHWRMALGGTLAGFLIPTAITIAIWVASDAHVFFWPLFVVLGTGMGFVNVLANRKKMIADRKRVLTKRARARLGDSDAQREIREHPGRYDIDDDDRDARRRLRHEQRRRRHGLN